MNPQLIHIYDKFSSKYLEACSANETLATILYYLYFYADLLSETCI